MDMLYREDNESRWVGTRPARQGTLVSKSAQANNNTVNVHTVTSGKTFFLTSGGLSISTNAAGVATLAWQHGGSIVRVLARIQIQTAAGSTVSVPLNYTFPLEIPAGDTIDVISTAGGINCRGDVDGWEE